MFYLNLIKFDRQQQTHWDQQHLIPCLLVKKKQFHLVTKNLIKVDNKNCHVKNMVYRLMIVTFGFWWLCSCDEINFAGGQLLFFSTVLQKTICITIPTESLSIKLWRTVKTVIVNNFNQYWISKWCYLKFF